jgi:hypothetical protein
MRAYRPKLFVCEWRVHHGEIIEAGQFTVAAVHFLAARQAAKKTVRTYAAGLSYQIELREPSIGERIIESLTPGDHVRLETAPPGVGCQAKPPPAPTSAHN